MCIRDSPKVTNTYDLELSLQGTAAWEKDGLVLLSAKMQVQGFIGIDEAAWADLRSDGRIHLLMQAIAKSTAYGAIIVRNKITQDSAMNVHGALEGLGVEVLAHVQYEPTVGGTTQGQTLRDAGPQNFTANPRYFSQDDDEITYRGWHLAPTSRSGARLDNLTEIYPDDVYGPMAARYYGAGADRREDAKVMALLQSLRDKPDAKVTVYRAIPNGAMARINPGDWVSVSRAYADEHGWRQFEEGHQVVELEVKASHLWTDANSLYEQGYDPTDRPQVLMQDDDDNPPVRVDRTMFVQKNVDWRGFERLVFDGGLWAPSIGIAGVNTPYEDFGEVTLIGKPSVVNPAKVPVFGLSLIHI
jgi:hypothetical protein